MKIYAERASIENTFSDGFKAFHLLGNPLQYPEFHPIITKVDKLDDTNFLCYEKVKILAFTFLIKYNVVVSRPENSVVKMRSEVQKGITLNLTFELIYPHKVKELIEVHGAFFMSKILIRKVQKAHLQMVRNIQKAQKAN